MCECVRVGCVVVVVVSGVNSAGRGEGEREGGGKSTCVIMKQLMCSFTSGKFSPVGGGVCGCAIGDVVVCSADRVRSGGGVRESVGNSFC